MMFKLSKQGNLRKNQNFQAVYRAGKSYANRMAVLYVLPNKTGSRRIGFAAGKRLGGAVVRNRVKRLLREAYRLHQEKLIDGLDLVLVGRQSIIDAKLPAVVKSFLDLCARAKIIKK